MTITYTYDPSGQRIAKALDSVIDLYCYGARYYNPYVDRFVQADPARGFVIAAPSAMKPEDSG